VSAAGAGLGLSTTGLRAGYGGIEVLHGIDLEVAPGQIFALLGRNGAGKSTLLRALSGRMLPTAGQIRVGGEVIRRAAPERLARRGLCCIPEGRGVFPNLTVDEHLLLWTYRGGVDRDRMAHDVYARFPILGERRQQLAGSLSGGERQMLSLSRALCPGVRALLCDELSMGLAPRVVEQLYTFVAELGATGVTVLVVEQFAQTALRVASAAAVLVDGRIRLSGSPEEVGKGLSRAYLGVDSGSGSDPAP
jgi:branched-chain amino acid transport system ATP-binding protein